MCGIAGFAGDGDKADLEAMTRAVAHRGPDGEGTWHNKDRTVALAHRRLAIIDLSEAAGQPMRGPNGTAIIHNGEVFRSGPPKELESDPEVRRVYLGESFRFGAHPSTSKTEAVSR